MAKALNFTSIAAAALLAIVSTVGTAHAATTPKGISGSNATTPSTPSTLAAGDLTINVAGISSFDAADAPINTILTLDVLPNALIDAFSFNLTIATAGLSYLSEATILFTNTNGDGVFFTPGFGDDFSGTATYADAFALSDFGLSFNAGADGKLYVQFFEAFDDVAGAADATYTAGTITFNGVTAAVPEPSTYAMMAIGLLGFALAKRRSQG